VVARYAEAASRAGDAARGREVFSRAGCAACHRLGGAGIELGPDLATVADKPAAQLIEAIFDPNRAYEARYALTVVVLANGTVTSGVVAADLPGGIVLRQPGGAERVIPRGEIDELRPLPQSIMPEGIETLVSPADCADLLAAIRGR
jgi:putative heme-binding domain-containing protein